MMAGYPGPTSRDGGARGDDHGEAGGGRGKVTAGVGGARGRERDHHGHALDRGEYRRDPVLLRQRR